MLSPTPELVAWSQKPILTESITSFPSIGSSSDEDEDEETTRSTINSNEDESDNSNSITYDDHSTDSDEEDKPPLPLQISPNPLNTTPSNQNHQQHPLQETLLRLLSTLQKSLTNNLTSPHPPNSNRIVKDLQASITILTQAFEVVEIQKVRDDKIKFMVGQGRVVIERLRDKNKVLTLENEEVKKLLKESTLPPPLPPLPPSPSPKQEAIEGMISITITEHTAIKNNLKTLQNLLTHTQKTLQSLQTSSAYLEKKILLEKKGRKDIEVVAEERGKEVDRLKKVLRGVLNVDNSKHSASVGVSVSGGIERKRRERRRDRERYDDYNYDYDYDEVESKQIEMVKKDDGRPPLHYTPQLLPLPNYNNDDDDEDYDQYESELKNETMNTSSISSNISSSSSKYIVPQPHSTPKDESNFSISQDNNDVTSVGNSSYSSLVDITKSGDNLITFSCDNDDDDDGDGEYGEGGNEEEEVEVEIEGVMSSFELANGGSDKSNEEWEEGDEGYDDHIVDEYEGEEGENRNGDEKSREEEEEDDYNVIAERFK